MMEFPHPDVARSATTGWASQTRHLPLSRQVKASWPAGRRRYLPALLLVAPVKAATDDAFDDEVVGGGSGADAEAEIELPFGRDVEIDRSKKLLLLLPCGIELGGGTKGTVILQSACDLFREVVAEFEIGRETDSLMNA